MRENIYIKSIYFLDKIFDDKQKKLAFVLLITMILGMFFEVLLLKNLLTLLNYLTNSNTNVPDIVFLISNQIKFNDITIIVLLVFIFTFLLKTLTNILVKWKESKFIYTIKAQISEKLFTGYMNLPLIFHQRTNTAKLLKNITLEIEQFAIFIFSISKLILEILIMLGISIYLLFVDFYTSIFCILAFILFGYLFNYFNKNKLISMSKKRIYHQDERVKSIMEGLAGMREIKLLSKESAVLKNFNYHNLSISQISISSTLRNALSKPSFEIFMILILSIFLIYFISNNLLNASIIPIFGIYLAAAYRLVPSISQIVQSVQGIQFNLHCVKNLYDDFKKFKVNAEKEIKKDPSLSFNERIEFRNVSFSYSLENKKSENNVLKHTNLLIKKGDCIGIQGKSGAGKSTFIDLLIGLQKPSSGKILVDNLDIYENIKKWQNLIGCVPQEVFITDDTLKKNIAFGEPENQISDEKVDKCLIFSNLKNFSQTLLEKTNTIIGEKGSRLSGGQKQRIGIARALYNNPEILIFDESTSSLDNETEQKIISEINTFKRKKTVIIISHKKEILKNCDHIYTIKNKQITKND